MPVMLYCAVKAARANLDNVLTDARCGFASSVESSVTSHVTQHVTQHVDMTSICSVSDNAKVNLEFRNGGGSNYEPTTSLSIFFLDKIVILIGYSFN